MADQHQHADFAEQQMDQYWNRDFTADADLDTQQRIAELLQVIAEASVSIAKSLSQQTL